MPCKYLIPTNAYSKLKICTRDAVEIVLIRLWPSGDAVYFSALLFIPFPSPFLSQLPVMFSELSSFLAKKFIIHFGHFFFLYISDKRIPAGRIHGRIG